MSMNALTFTQRSIGRAVCPPFLSLITLFLLEVCDHLSPHFQVRSQPFRPLTTAPSPSPSPTPTPSPSPSSSSASSESEGSGNEKSSGGGSRLGLVVLLGATAAAAVYSVTLLFLFPLSAPLHSPPIHCHTPYPSSHSFLVPTR